MEGISAALPPILIADDESEDRFILEKTLRRAGVTNPIVGFRDGEELIDHLGRELSAAKPLGQIAALLLLDIKMPMVDGLDALRWIRENPILNALKVAIVSSSRHPRDVERASELGVAGYLEKYPTAAALNELLGV